MSIFMLGCIVSNIAIGSMGSTYVKADDTLVPVTGAKYMLDIKDGEFPYIDKDGKAGRTNNNEYVESEKILTSKEKVDVVSESAITHLTKASMFGSAKSEQDLLAELQEAVGYNSNSKVYSMPRSNIRGSAESVLSTMEFVYGSEIKNYLNNYTPVFVIPLGINNSYITNEKSDKYSFIKIILAGNKGQGYINLTFWFSGFGIMNNDLEIMLEEKKTNTLDISFNTKLVNNIFDSTKTLPTELEEVYSYIGNNIDDIITDVIHASSTNKTLLNSIKSTWDVDNGIRYWLEIKYGITNKQQYTKHSSGESRNVIEESVLCNAVGGTTRFNLGNFSIKTNEAEWGISIVAGENGLSTEGEVPRFLMATILNSYSGSLSKMGKSFESMKVLYSEIGFSNLNNIPQVVQSTIEYWYTLEQNIIKEQVDALNSFNATRTASKSSELVGVTRVPKNIIKGLTVVAENNLKYNSGESTSNAAISIFNLEYKEDLSRLKSTSGSAVSLSVVEPLRIYGESFDKNLKTRKNGGRGVRDSNVSISVGDSNTVSGQAIMILANNDSYVSVAKNALKKFIDPSSDKWFRLFGLSQENEVSYSNALKFDPDKINDTDRYAIITIRQLLKYLSEQDDKTIINELDSLASSYRYTIDQISKAKDVPVSQLFIIKDLYEYSYKSRVVSDVTGKDTKELTAQTLAGSIKFGDDYTVSSIGDLSKKATENLELTAYTQSKLWIMQYAYELTLFNLNASLFGYYEEGKDIDNLEEGSTVTEASIQAAASDVNKVKNKQLYAESQTNFNSIYGTASLVSEEESRKILALMPRFVPKMKAFGDYGLAALQDRGYLKDGDYNPPYYNFQKILYEIASAFDIAYSLGGNNEFDERGYGPDTLKKKLKEWESKNKAYDTETFDGNAVSVNMVRSVIALDKVCRLLRIDEDGWTEVIKLYRDKELVDGCYKYANNFLIQNSLTSEKTGLNPLGMFFDVKKKSMSKEWAQGFALSALFVPLQTNLNSAESTSYLNKESWIKDFYYKYGFYRKGLYIDTDNSSVTNNFIKGSSGGRRPATLNDLINYKRDITLYIDDNFYNLDKTVEVINRVNDGGDIGTEFQKAASVAAVQAQAQQNNSTTSPAATQSSGGNSAAEIVNTPKSGMFGSMLGLVPDDILKSGSTTYYKDDIAKSVKRLDVIDGNSGEGTYEKFVLGAKDITKALDEDEYSIRQPYAVVSTVYRHRELYKELSKAISNEGAIFKSSNTIAQMPVALPKDYGTYMNYIMLSNLSEAMDNSVGIELDKDSPIFTDIFGNIISESGTVIIPAASNATLTNDYWSPANLGFATYYGYANKIPSDFGSDDFKEWLTGTVEIEEDVDYAGTPNNSAAATSSAMRVKRTDFSAKYKNHEQGSGWFVKGQNYYNLKTTTISAFDQSATVVWNTISKNSESLKKVFYKNAFYNIAPKMYSPRLANQVVEALRGAPIENINLEQEGLTGTRDISKVGLTIAYGYEQLMKSIQPALNSSIVNMPNLAFISGVEYAIMYIYKFMFAVFILIFIFTLYINAVKKSLGFKVFLVFILTVLGTVASITIIPDVISFSYYTACRDLLKDEASYIAMLNYNKDLNGVELGVTEVSTPKTSTELYMKLDNLNVDWTTIMNKVLFNKTADTLTELYKEEFDKNLVSKQPGVVQKGDGLYLKMNDVLKSIEVVYNPDIKSLMIQNHSLDGNVLSYVSPYYVVLNELVNSINEYNFKQDIESYQVDENVTGKVTTKDVISAYLKSPEFLDKGYDITGFHKIYQTESSLLPANNYSYYPTDGGEGDIGLMKRSLWFPKNAGPELIDKVDKLADYARYYVARNKDTIGKVPDEAFLKVMALSIAMEHNKIFNVPAGKSIEIANVDVADIMRFMIGKKADVYRTFNLSYPRAVYELGGGPSVVVSVLYSITIFFATYIKPGLVILIVLMLIVNIIKEMVFSKDRNGRKVLEGYLITCGLIIGVNYLYALMLTVSIKLAQIGLGTFLTLLFGTLVQIGYIYGLVMVFLYVIRDYRQLGLEAYQAAFGMLRQAVGGAKNRVGSKFSNWRSRRESILRERSAMAGVDTEVVEDSITTTYEESASSTPGVDDVFGEDTVSSMESRDSARYEEAFKSDI